MYTVSSIIIINITIFDKRKSKNDNIDFLEKEQGGIYTYICSIIVQHWYIMNRYVNLTWFNIREVNIVCRCDVKKKV